jgi:hypothetical protein
MPRKVLCLCTAMLLAGAAVAAGEETAPATAPSTAEHPSLWFDVGERLLYDIYWGFIHVATTEVTTQWVEEEGQPLRIRITYRTKSNNVIAKIYPVDDILESVIDAETFLPVSFKKKQSEGGYRSDEFTVFDHDGGTMLWKSLLNGDEKTFPIDPDTRDLITLMYYFRSMNFYVGKQLNFRVMADEKLYDLYVEVTKREDIKLSEYGKVPSFQFAPQAAFQGLFVRKGKVTFWVSDDDRKLCTQIEAEVPVANVRLKLREVSGPGDDFWISALENEDDAGSKRTRIGPRRR